MQFHVVEVKAPAVLQRNGIYWPEQHCIPECFTVTNQNIFNEYSDLFQGLGCIPGEHLIKVDPSVPAVVHPHRKVPVSLKDKIKDELDRMEQTGVIIRQT